MSLHGARTMAQLQENDIIICFILSSVCVVFTSMLYAVRRAFCGWRQLSWHWKITQSWLVLTLFRAWWAKRVRISLKPSQKVVVGHGWLENINVPLSGVFTASAQSSLAESPTKTANFYLFHLHCHAIPTFSSLCAASMQRKPWIFTPRLSRLHQVHTINRHCAQKAVENLLREN